jgi:hypothetical protein
MSDVLKDRYEAAVKSLTKLQRDFIHAKMKHRFASQIAEACGSTTKNPDQWADAMFRKPAVRAAFFALRDYLEGEEHMGIAEAKRVLASIARGNVGDFLDTQGIVSSERLVDPVLRGRLDGLVERTIQINENVSSVERTITLGNRVGALNLLGKWNAWEAEQKVDAKVQITGLVALKDFVSQNTPPTPSASADSDGEG